MPIHKKKGAKRIGKFVKKAEKKARKAKKAVKKAEPKPIKRVEKKVKKAEKKVKKKAKREIKKFIKRAEKGKIFGANLVPSSGSVSSGVKVGGHMGEKQQIFHGFHPEARPNPIKVVKHSKIVKDHPQHKMQQKAKSVRQEREHPHFGRSSRVGRPQ